MADYSGFDCQIIEI